MFISFEGPDGAGKSTQIALLADALKNSGHEVVVTREPGGTRLGEVIRVLLLDSDVPIAPETEAYLMTAARAEHVRERIRPALAAGKIVLCDRFLDSTLAYQGGGRGLSVQELRDLQRLAVGDTVPTLRVLLDLETSIGLARKHDVDTLNRLDRESADFHQRVARWFRREARRRADQWLVVDAGQSPDVVHDAIVDGLSERLNIEIRDRLEGAVR